MEGAAEELEERPGADVAGRQRGLGVASGRGGDEGRVMPRR